MALVQVETTAIIDSIHQIGHVLLEFVSDVPYLPLNEDFFDRITPIQRKTMNSLIEKGVDSLVAKNHKRELILRVAFDSIYRSLEVRNYNKRKMNAESILLTLDKISDLSTVTIKEKKPTSLRSFFSFLMNEVNEKLEDLMIVDVDFGVLYQIMKKIKDINYLRILKTFLKSKKENNKTTSSSSQSPSPSSVMDILKDYGLLDEKNHQYIFASTSEPHLFLGYSRTYSILRTFLLENQITLTEEIFQKNPKYLDLPIDELNSLKEICVPFDSNVPPDAKPNQWTLIQGKNLNVPVFHRWNDKNLFVYLLQKSKFKKKGKNTRGAAFSHLLKSCQDQFPGKELVFRGIPATCHLYRSNLIYGLQESSIVTDLEFGPGTYTTPDLEYAFDYCIGQGEGVIFIFDWTNVRNQIPPLLILDLQGDQWIQTLRQFLHLGGMGLINYYEVNDFVCGAISSNHEAITAGHEPIPGPITQNVATSHNGRTYLRNNLLGIIYVVL
jgi:hypothetical protein